MQILDSLLSGHLRDEAAYCHGATDHHLSTEYHACSSYFVYLTLALTDFILHSGNSGLVVGVDYFNGNHWIEDVKTTCPKSTSEFQ